MIVQLYVMGALHPLDITGCYTVKDIKILISRKVSCQSIRPHHSSILCLFRISSSFLETMSSRIIVWYFCCCCLPTVDFRSRNQQ